MAAVAVVVPGLPFVVQDQLSSWVQDCYYVQLVLKVIGLALSLDITGLDYQDQCALPLLTMLFI